MNNLSSILPEQWREIRRLTYDYLDVLSMSDLDLRLPFPESQTLGYQFWCMVGAHESYLNKLEHGTWQGFSSSLDQLASITPATIKDQMLIADDKMERVLTSIDLDAPLANGQAGYDVIFQMIKHEMHHHGQLINFTYCHHLPIPASWQDEWALSYGE